MYSHEIQEYIKLRNYLIGGDDLLTLTSIEENPQLNHIIYHPDSSSYEMWDRDGEYFNFKAMNYEEAKQKGLVKKRGGNKNE